MKKIISMLMAVFMLISMFPVTAFAVTGEPRIYFETTFEEDMTVDDTFTVTAILENNPGVNAITVTWDWNDKVVEFVDFVYDSDGYFVSDVMWSKGWTADCNPDNAKAGAMNSSDSTTNGILFVGEFRIIAGGDPEIRLADEDNTEFNMTNIALESIVPEIDYSAISNLNVEGSLAAPDMPEDAPFTAITTDAGNITGIEQQDDISGIPYYVVTIPADATTAYITAPDQVVMKDYTTGEMKATAYAAPILNDGDMLYISYDYEEVDDGIKVEIPMNMMVSDWSGEVELCFAGDADCDATHAFGIEDANFACLALISFLYAEDTGFGEDPELTVYAINIDDAIEGGSVIATNEDGEEITEAAEGDVVHLEPVAEDGYAFKTFQVTYDGGSLDASNYKFQMPAADVVVSAEFTSQTYEIHVNTSENGTVSAEPAYAAEGAVVALTVNADENYELDSLTVKSGENEIEVNEDYTFIMPAGEVSVTAEFKEITRYSITVNAEHGSVIPGKELAAEGESITLDVEAQEGYELESLIVTSGDSQITVDENNTFKMPAGNVVVTATFKKLAAEGDGYTFAASADVTAENGGTATVSVKVTGHVDETVTEYNAYDVTLTFDNGKLELVTDESGNIEYDGAVKDDGGTVTADGNSVHIVGCSKDKSFDQELVILKFKTKAEGAAEVNISKVQVSDKEDAIDKNAPEAEADHADDTVNDDTPATSVIKVPYTVEKPDFVTGKDKVLHGYEYTFSFSDTTNYKYENLKVTVGGEQVTPAEENGVYTIANVTGAVVITAERIANSYPVTKPENVEGENQATYGQDYVFKVKETEGKIVDSVKITLEDGTEITYTFDTEKKEYTIAGKDIAGAFTSVVEEKDAVKMTKIIFEGIEVEEIEGGSLTASAEIGKDYTFKLIKDEKYTYEVKVGDTELKETEDGYTINGSLIGEENVIVKITKNDIVKLSVEASEYITLDGKAMFLITAKWGDKVLAYGEDTMYYSAKYSVEGYEEAGAYCWLVLSTDEMNTAELVKEEAEKLIAQAAEGSTAKDIAYNYDVNGTTAVDVNDAQLVYDMYNASYDEFTENLPMKKFLEADVKNDKKLDTKDVAAIINYIVSGAMAAQQ